jgi:hypothetical protein
VAHLKIRNHNLIAVERFAEFEIHPGLVKALYNVSNIIETNEVEPFNENVTFEKSVDQLGVEINTPKDYDIELQPVYFDADVEVEGVISGMVSKPTSDGEKKLCLPNEYWVCSTWPKRISAEQYSITAFGNTSGYNRRNHRL